MSLSKLAVKKPITVLMAVLAVFFVGYLAMNGLNIDLFPNIDFPVAFIQAAYPGVDPQEMENIVTKEIEDEVSTVSDIDKMTSYSLQDFAHVVIEFDWGTDIDMAAIDLREKTDIVKRVLPDDIDSVIVSKFDINSQPLMTISVASEKMDLISLRTLVDDEIKPLFERTGGVASADVSGGLEREIHVDVDPVRLEKYNIAISDIISAIYSGNKNISSGDLEEGQFKYLVRTEGEAETLEELRNITVKKKGGSIICVKDLADVVDTYKEVDSKSRMNNQNSVTVTIKKESEANPVNISNGIRKTIESLKSKYPNLSFNIGRDSSEFIQDSINMTKSNALMGGLLAVVVLLIFLKNIRSTLIIGVSIPVSIIATFSMLYLKEDVTLNLMTLGGLALGIGMLLDNSIVVLENIYRFFKENHDNDSEDNAIKGSDQVAMPVLASTLTTLAVFAPLGFVPGMVGEIFFNLALSIIFALISSYIVAFTVIPTLTSKFLKVKKDHVEEGKFFRFVKSNYEKFLTLIISKKRNTVLYFSGVIGVFVICMALFPPTEFFPSMDRGEFSIDVELAEGTNLDTVDNTISRVEEIMFKELRSEENPDGLLEKVVTNISLGSASIQVKMVPDDQRTVITDDYIQTLRPEFNKIPNIKQITFNTPKMGRGGGKPVSIEITGDDFDVLEQICIDISKKMENIDGLTEIDNGVDKGRPEIKINLDREKIRDLDFTVTQVASEVRSYIYGSVASTFKENNDEYDIRVKLKDGIVNNFEKIRDMRMFIKGKTVVLSNIADIKLDYGYTRIIRKDKKRTLTIESDIYGRPLGAIIQDIMPVLKNQSMPEGYFYKFGGDEEERKESFADLGLALLAAVFLVYMIMASQFESLLEPFVIMFTIPLSIIGVVVFLNVFNFSFSVTAIIGIIMLAGIVVNNGILLIEYINLRRREEGHERNVAILEAGLVRIRPILMTSMTTILGMVPLGLGIGAGSDFFQPLAVTVIGGLMFSSVLTLTFVPAAFIIVEDMREYFYGLFKRIRGVA